ncbi:hypothetical protein A374_06106 [Fictibacillus macauensis ZFHKF-1]|uniref:Uncharacterized protein n=1 Tax=Fictibacillus macauensis ZFHKF-1 TaxID=1196324 RepID=I8AKP9_9BACL|nr:hypothetical protein [Fictibacillus macauensis]EIT86149.1 hypothetical protein A374_06106 [Fictibacillus macauensis ZFHKF-1]
MMHFWTLRLQRRSCYYALLIGTALAVFQLIMKVGEINTYDDIIFTPYTSWLSIDSTPITLVFFLVLPLLASIPAATLFQEDSKNGLLSSLFVTLRRRTYFSHLFFTTFLTGMIVVGLPLLLNAFGFFLFLPNTPPDEMINRNVGIYEGFALFSSLFYSHPFVHMLLNIVLCSVFAGLYAVFSLSVSFWVKNTFLVVTGGFLLQVLLYSVNIVFFPGIDITPLNFLPVHSLFFQVNGSLVVWVGSAMFLGACLLYYTGARRHETM